MKKLLLTLAVAGFIGSSLSAMADDDRADHNWNDEYWHHQHYAYWHASAVTGRPTITIMNSSGWVR